MKIPKVPQPTGSLLKQYMATPESVARIWGAGPSTTVKGRYVHWDKLLYYTPPGDLSHEEWWASIKIARATLLRHLPLLDKAGNQFALAVPDPLLRGLSEIDRDLSGRVEMPQELNTPGIRDRYLISALIEEAITSSQLEGAATTRKEAKKMLRSGRKPRNHDERMIFNNFLAMEYVRKIADKPITPDLVFTIHRHVTDGTLDDPNDAGRLRERDDICVYAPDGTVLHTPPSARELPERLARCCKFANDRGTDPFIHPIARAILLHFCIGYDHPFVDGNGRTARALFYWSMLHSRYSLCEYLSVSSILHKAPAKYTRSYLHTETDEGDTTYFVLYQMGVMQRAIRALHEYVVSKATDMRRTKLIMKQSRDLNYRQVALLTHALGHPDSQFSATSHANSHGVTRQTARNDLKGLAELGLLDQMQAGNAFVFTVPADLETSLAGMSRPAGAR